MSTDIVDFADDRTYWSPDTLSGLLDALDDPKVGGVNTIQNVISTGRCPRLRNTGESFGALNLGRRNILHSLLAYVNDVQALNLSGRTVAYRTKIPKSERFTAAFLNDSYNGKHILWTADDNFLTTWTLHHRWKTAFVAYSSITVSCWVCPDRIYVKTVLHWSRDTARYYTGDLSWAWKDGGQQHVIGCLLNFVCNYTSDVIMVIELCAQLLDSILLGWLRLCGDSQQWYSPARS